MSIPLSLYIHIPWCVQKCPYCDFNSHTVRSKVLPEKDYVTRLLEDLANDVARFAEVRPLTSIFIGGGTPSLFSGNAMTDLLQGVNQYLSINHDTEITLEANPGTVDERHFAAYRRIGVNRISIGVQSFDSEQLQRLGRIHNPADAVRAVKTAQDVGFDNINIDLMFGLPQQTAEQAIYDVEQGIALNTEHLSYYQLTLEPNTAFAHSPPKLPAEECIDERFELAAKQLIAANFVRYEVSAWSRGRQAKHNLNYWQYGDYLGIGAGAHGKITVFEQDSQQIIRTTKPRAPNHYLGTQQAATVLKNTSSAINLRQERRVREEEKAFEFMLNTLRLMQGFQQVWIEERGLIPYDSVRETLQTLIDKGLLVHNKQQIFPTALGKRFVNDMVEAFLSN